MTRQLIDSKVRVGGVGEGDGWLGHGSVKGAGSLSLPAMDGWREEGVCDDLNCKFSLLIGIRKRYTLAWPSYVLAFLPGRGGVALSPLNFGQFCTSNLLLSSCMS